MDQGTGWLIIVLIWCLSLLVTGGLVFVLFFLHFRKKHPPLSAFALACLAVAVIAVLMFFRSLLPSFLSYIGL